MDARLTSLKAAVVPDLPPWLALAIADARNPQPELFAIENAAMARAVDTRRAEFRAGRAAARAALAMLDVPDEPIPMGADRAPVWPDGICASISHTGPLCIAVAARITDARSIGVDVEHADRLPDDLLDTVATARECAAMNDAQLAGRRVFSAKEAAYKAQFPISHTVFDFATLQFEAPADQSPYLRFASAVPPFAENDRIALRQWVHSGLILSLSILPVQSA